MRKVLIFLLFTVIIAKAYSQQRYSTTPLSGDIKSLQVRVSDNPDLPPVIKRNSDETITIKFDLMDDDKEWISYRIKHLTSDWRESTISDIDYLQGFNNNQVEDIAPSFNTYINYYNYALTIPNDEVRLKASGNYVVEFYKNSEPDNIIATACFSVYEDLIRVNPEVSSNTEIGRAHV